VLLYLLSCVFGIAISFTGVRVRVRVRARVRARVRVS